MVFEEVGVIDRNMKFDTISINPPYSLAYEAGAKFEADKRFYNYPLAPKSKADYMFLLDALYRLEDSGKLVVLYPHGILFRSGAELEIRKSLIEQNLIDAVIGLPSKLFAATDIPTVILIVQKQKRDNSIYFIDASQGFEQVKAKNNLREEDVTRILDAYQSKRDIERYARNVSIEEIKENNYNLNIPRYVDIREPEEPVDIFKLSKEYKEIEDEIAKTKKQLISMMNMLVGDEKAMKELNMMIEAISYTGNADNYNPKQLEPVQEIMNSVTELPTAEMQQMTFEMYNAIEDKENQIEKRIEQLSELKKDMLDKMFIS